MDDSLGCLGFGVIENDTGSEWDRKGVFGCRYVRREAIEVDSVVRLELIVDWYEGEDGDEWVRLESVWNCVVKIEKRE